MEKQSLGELDLLTETISHRTEIPVSSVDAVITAARDLGWELSKRRTHADVHLPQSDRQMGGLPSLHDLQMGSK